VSISRQIEVDLSHYLATVTTVNFMLAIAVAAAMHWLEVPNPVLWGAMAGLFNFAPYVGALVSAAIMTIVGITTFDTLSDALMVPLTLLVLTILEGQVITPSVLGRRLAVHPLVVFLSIVFWGWLWGIAGALMAVPIITCLKVITDHVPQLNFLARFIRRESDLPEIGAIPPNSCKTFNSGRPGKERRQHESP
jgi:predicted PurR-regulated permease PerM